MKRKKLNILIIMGIILLFIPIVTVFGLTIANAINEMHGVSLVSDGYVINGNSNYLLKESNDNSYTLTITNSTLPNELNYDILAVPVKNDPNSIDTGSFIGTGNTAQYTVSIPATSPMHNKTCYFIIVPHLKYNAYVTSFFELQMLNTEYRHQIIDNDSDIPNNIVIEDGKTYSFETDIYNSGFYKDIYFLNDIVIPVDHVINVPSSLHLLTNEIILNANLSMENYYKGIYSIDNMTIGNVSGAITIVEQTQTTDTPPMPKVTIHTPNAVYMNIDESIFESEDSFSIDNSYNMLEASISFAESFFVKDIRVKNGDDDILYTALFTDIILPTRFNDKSVTISYYINYGAADQSDFNVLDLREEQVKTVDVTIVASDGKESLTTVCPVWIVGTSNASIDLSFSKILEYQISKGLAKSHCNEMYINIDKGDSSFLNSFLKMANKSISLVETPTVDDIELTSEGVKISIEGPDDLRKYQYLYIERNTFNGIGKIFVNGDTENFVQIELMTLTIEEIKDEMESDIRQIYFSSEENAEFPIIKETDYMFKYNLDNVTYSIKEVFSGETRDTSKITYDPEKGCLVNNGATYSSLYEYYLQVDIQEDGNDYIMTFPIYVPSSSTGGDDGNNIISNLFTVNFDAMSTFIGTSNNFLSPVANFYMEITNENVSNFINIYFSEGSGGNSQNKVLTESDNIINQSFYFKTTESAIPENNTTIYVNAYVTDRDIYTTGTEMKAAYSALQSFDLRNGLFTADMLPITSIFNNSRTINITYDESGVVNSITSTDGTVTYTNPTIDLTSYSFEYVVNETTNVSPIFYDKDGKCISIFLQTYSFVIPGIYQETDFGTSGNNLYELLMEEYGYFEEMLPQTVETERKKYLLSDSVRNVNEIFTNKITLEYSSDNTITVKNIREMNGRYEVMLDSYFYYLDNDTKNTVFYSSSDIATRVLLTGLYDLQNGIYDINGNEITTIYKDISSVIGNMTNRIDELYKLTNTSKFLINNVDIDESHLSSFISKSNTVITDIDLFNCNLNYSNRFDFCNITNLTTLNLSNNNLESLPVLGLKVSKLNMSSNTLTDITDIKENPLLVDIDLSNNSIKEFLPLLDVDNLKTLNIENNLVNSSESFYDLTSADNDTIAAYGTNGEINKGTLIILYDKGVTITGFSIDSLGTGEEELAQYIDAYYVINAIVPLNSYKDSFTIDLSQNTSYNLITGNRVILSYKIYINNEEIAYLTDDPYNYVKSLGNGTYSAIIELMYKESVPDTTAEGGYTGEEYVVVYRQITFEIVS